MLVMYNTYQINLMHKSQGYNGIEMTCDFKISRQ